MSFWCFALSTASRRKTRGPPVWPLIVAVFTRWLSESSCRWGWRGGGATKDARTWLLILNTTDQTVATLVLWGCRLNVRITHISRRHINFTMAVIFFIVCFFLSLAGHCKLFKYLILFLCLGDGPHCSASAVFCETKSEIVKHMNKCKWLKTLQTSQRC